MHGQFVYFASDALLLLAAIFGFVMVFRMWPSAPRLLALFGVALVLGHAVWSLLGPVLRWEDGIPPALLKILSWASYVVLLVGLLLLVLAATKRAAPAASARSYAPYQPGPHQPQPAEPQWEPGGQQGRHPGGAWTSSPSQDWRPASGTGPQLSPEPPPHPPENPLAR